ncbi:MAG: hypothetical protein WBC63_05820 [Candidatus Bipolaricaulia bacterium]
MHIRTAGETDIDAIRMLLDEQNAFHVWLLPGFFRLHPTTSRESVTSWTIRTATISWPRKMEGPGARRTALEEDERPTDPRPEDVRGHRRDDRGRRLPRTRDRLSTDGGRPSLARERGAESLHTSVVPANERARAFYVKHGFTDTMVSIEAEI